jgi:hypothetical protein
MSKEHEVWKDGRLIDASVSGMVCVHHVGVSPGMVCSACTYMRVYVEPQPGTLEYAERMADQHGDFDDAAIEDGMDPASEEARRRFLTEPVVRPRSPEPHAYVIEVLVNAGSMSEHWGTYDDIEFTRTDERGEAEEYRLRLIEDGYVPEHLRVVGLVTL